MLTIPNTDLTVAITFVTMVSRYEDVNYLEILQQYVNEYLLIINISRKYIYL